MPAALKDRYDTAYISELAHAIQRHHPAFETTRFKSLVFDELWTQRELKARMHHISGCLHDTLQRPFPEAIAVLRQTAPDFGGFEAMLFPHYVERYGQAHWDIALAALADLTQYSSSEFAVRPFILTDPEKMLAQMHLWAQDTNPHLRRLASEGCRPRLPWATALPLFKQDPRPLIPILTQLRQDSSDYVRRSVANNLNDISKDHPDTTLALSRQWWGQHPHSNWIIKHGLRTLFKQGNKDALTLVGHDKSTHISHARLTLNTTQVHIGDTLTLHADINSDKETLGALRVEYRIAYLKKNGSHTSKVFHLSKGQHPGSHWHMSKQHAFRQMSTRIHYPGSHSMHLIINGEEKSKIVFELLPEKE